jgi:ABC-2 type transport system ATP-binding protein
MNGSRRRRVSPVRRVLAAGLGAAALAASAIAAPDAATASVAAAHAGVAVAGRAERAATDPVDGPPELVKVPVGAEPDGTPVSLDVAFYLPRAQGRHPAVLLAHGFGGSRTDADGAARTLAGHGYLAVAYTARGFGASGGRIHLMDPALEGEDVRHLIDVIAARPDVQLDAPGDPRVGMTGGSYGGAATLVAGGLDSRLDALAAAITWNDLADAFFPDFAAAQLPAGELAPGGGGGTSPGAPGPFKRRWASQFFSGALASAAAGGTAPTAAGGTAGTAPGGTAPSAPASAAPSVAAGTGAPATATRGPAPSAGGGSVTAVPTCGRFDATICRLFLEAAQTGKPSDPLIAELHRRGPALTNGKITAPTLLLQGMSDSLFPADQAEANARQIAANGTPVAVRWMEGGHDGGALSDAAPQGGGTGAAGTPAAGAASAATAGGPPASDPASLSTRWFDTYLRGDEPAAARRARPLPEPGFAYAAPAYARGAPAREVSVPTYPGLRPDAPTTSPVELAFADPKQSAALLSPPGGDPAATSAIPGAGPAGADGLGNAAYRLAALPGQSVAFDTVGVPAAVTVVGSPRVRLTVTSSATDATLFVSWWKVASGVPTSPRRQISPVRVATTPGVPTTVDMALPAGTYALDQGTTWRVLVSATDSAYATPTDARVYGVRLAGGGVLLPTLPTAVEPAPEADRETTGLLVALGVLLLGLAVAGAVAAVRRRRGDVAHGRADLAAVPLSVAHLVKTYADGHRAVDDVSWEAGQGQVVGLLGPNGAGKTTTIRMILGLITPDSGEVYVHGRLVHAGSPALAGIGALVEGPGFLPHLSGRANLEAYWAATGRPREEARFEEALEVAALGDAVERPVKAYSQGMRQRLGIAQAMLGMPEVLLLDEPTNGLDPPQIAAMRPILRRYAEAGRTVVVSSHLLAEVEMTCSHVVVMHRGRVVLTGSVPELVESADTTVVDLDGDLADAERVAARLRAGDSASAPFGARWAARRAGSGLRALHDVRSEIVDGTPRLVIHAGDDRADVARAVLAAGGRVVAFSGRRHLEEVFLGVIAADDLEAARKIRPR